MPDSGPLVTALAYAWLGGLTIPLGAWLAGRPQLFPRWLDGELRHTLLAFGAGALLAAVTLVLIPEGARFIPLWQQLLALSLGGVTFLLLEKHLPRTGLGLPLLLAMLLDFIPESMALGALLPQHAEAGLLLAVLIALQNLPEGFNAQRELQRLPAVAAHRHALLGLFAVLSLLGPLCAWLGMRYLHSSPMLLGWLMLFSAGGILYLMFQDIAPKIPLRQHWGPPLGTLAGYMLGWAGQHLLHGVGA
ncbi:zinc transporter, ZIP family [Atopomonas hussainii]|uniref:Zinc transporter, ZIP family n=1 Tax=Atopomonas hussainii TaxID=1429083 RepID=A0A1H7ND17_9GAMM|nr:hypothetical protein [Atopomonas hussainii]SEL20828.1 zinc transporter, ZIP family [Atopomonas hussainii]